MTPKERDEWLALADEFAQLRAANEASRMDVASSSYQAGLSNRQIECENRELLVCENHIRNVVRRNPHLMWRWHRHRLGQLAYQTHHWFNRSTDDNFDWTSRAEEIRRARDNIYQKLIKLGVI